MANPLVTAVMVTGRTPERMAFAQTAVQDFLRQTYQPMELLVIHQEPYFGTFEGENVREMRVPIHSMTLGEVRNVALEHVRGEWVIQWDDDDRYHPRRTEVQMEATKKNDGKPVLLARQIRIDTQTQEAFVSDQRTGIRGTILHRADVPHRYPALQQSEDDKFLQSFERWFILLNDPLLYIRQYHGGNTWDREHIMGRIGRNLTEPELQTLRDSYGFSPRHRAKDTLSERLHAAARNQQNGIPSISDHSTPKETWAQGRSDLPIDLGRNQK